MSTTTGANPGESSVPVVTNSTGPKIRVVQLDVPQADGSIATVDMEIVAIRDVDGTPLRISDRDVLLAIYAEILALRQMYGQATGYLFVAQPPPGAIS